VTLRCVTLRYIVLWEVYSYASVDEGRRVVCSPLRSALFYIDMCTLPGPLLAT
jgi:hypothetical protein